jgi:tetratricopeptide (TPR) repeat protein
MSVLSDQRVLVVGKLSSMGAREFRTFAAEHGATAAEPGDASATLIVIGDESWPKEAGASPLVVLDEATRGLVRSGRASVVAESALWERLGLVDSASAVRRLYTPAMLASLLGVSLSAVRSWQRRSLIRPAKLVHRLAYFDFTEVTAARRLAALDAAGVSPQRLARSLSSLARRFPEVARPLGELPLVVVGRQLLLRQDESLVDTAGQYRIDFDAADDEPEHPRDATAARNILAPPAFHADAPPATPDELLSAAAELEEQGDVSAAIDACRAALAAGGPKAEACFTLAELLYRSGDLAAARERYYMAVELDEDFVEARANLGCVLAETGQLELAAAALEGALECHRAYADAHYHLARVLDELGHSERAGAHWHTFLELAPDSPWADEARDRVTVTST